MTIQKLKEMADLTKRIAELQEMKHRVLEDMENDVKKMTKEDKIQAALSMPSLTPGHMDVLQEGFMTGSHVFGDPDIANDIDYCILCHPRAFIGHAVGAEFADYFELMKIIRTVKLIKNPYRDSSNFRTLESAFDEKWSRVRVFRALCDVLWPARQINYTNKTDEDLMKYSKCVKCHREAISFMTQASKDEYERTGVCERCRVGKVQ